LIFAVSPPLSLPLALFYAVDFCADFVILLLAL
jgi:hypothetical protein